MAAAAEGGGFDPAFAKIFVGGLSWETTDARLRAYFENFGAVQEAFVSYDRATGRPRGFGFVVFAPGPECAAVVDKVVAAPHTIDRREVEAKRALPKDASPVARDLQAAAAGRRTTKIFVGGLPPSADEAALRQYFGAFGPIDDCVVMVDHEHRRSRGFGFVTFREEGSVDACLARGALQSLHEKSVEVKRAVPREAAAPFASPRGGGAPRSPAPFGSARSGSFGRDRWQSGGGGGGYARERSSGPPAIVTGIPAALAAAAPGAGDAGAAGGSPLSPGGALSPAGALTTGMAALSVQPAAAAGGFGLAAAAALRPRDPASAAATAAAAALEHAAAPASAPPATPPPASTIWS
jgi:hypothetical protein